MTKVEQYCDLCLEGNSGKYCADFPKGKLEFPKLPEAIGPRKFGEPVQTPDRWIKDCENYQRVVRKLMQAKV